MKTIKETALMAHKKPRRSFETVVNGFKFTICFESKENWFVTIISFDPNWPHCHYLYCKTIEQLEKRVAEEIRDAEKTWRNGGRYPIV